MAEKDASATPKLHIDADWKAAAQAEKERLSQKEQERRAQTAERGELPEADFKALIDVLASQAIMSLGAFGDPKTGRVVVDPQGAKFSIDLLGVIEEKTKGNLDENESKHLQRMLSELRARFVQIMNLVAQQGAREQAAGKSDRSQEKPAQPDPAKGQTKIETPR